MNHVYLREFTADRRGLALENGRMWIGEADQDPEIFPIPVFWDEAKTIPALQPLQTSAGYIMRAGARADVYPSEEPYSLRIRDKAGVEVDYIASAIGPLAELLGPAGAGLVGFSQDETYPVDTVGKKLRQIVNVQDAPWNADATGGVDATVAIQAAINSLPFGGEVNLGRGTFKITALTVPDGVVITGDGYYASTLLFTSATGKITLGISSGVRDLKLAASVARTPDYEFVFIQKNGGFCRNLIVSNYSLGIRAGLIAGAIVVRPVIQNCNFFDPVVGVGTGAVALDHYSNAIITDCTGAGAALPAQQPDFGVRVRRGDTSYLANNNFTLHGRALLMDVPAPYNTFATVMVNCHWDTASLISGGQYSSSAEIIPSGGVYDTLICNTWGGLATNKSGFFVEAQGAGVVDGIAFTGCEFADNGDSGLLVSGVGVKNWVVSGGYSSGSGDAGIRAGGGTCDFVITGHRAGPVSARGANSYGIKVDNAAASDRYLISSNDVTGNNTANLFDGGTGGDARVTDNLGFNGAAAPSTVSVGGSPYTYNAGHTPEVLYIGGGTFSDVKQDGVSLPLSAGMTVLLKPNGSCTITYTVAPTVKKKLL